MNRTTHPITLLFLGHSTTSRDPGIFGWIPARIKRRCSEKMKVMVGLTISKCYTVARMLRGSLRRFDLSMRSSDHCLSSVFSATLMLFCVISRGIYHDCEPDVEGDRVQNLFYASLTSFISKLCSIQCIFCSIHTV